MTKVIYFLQNRKRRKKVEDLKKFYLLEKSFSHGRDVILKNERMIISYNRKYIRVMIFNDKKNKMAKEITYFLENK